MGKINKNGYKFFICFIAGLMCGCIIGSLGISILVSYRMDSFYKKIEYLENTITDKDEKLKKLEKAINNSDVVLKDIQIFLDFPGFSTEQIEQINNLEIEKAIKEKYRSSLGKEIKNLDGDILLQIIDKRILKFDGAEYQLKVNKLILTEILKLWVEISVIEVES